MNERIKQLAEQCESFGSWDNKTYSFDKEKFAVLIAKECIDIAQDRAMVKGEPVNDVNYVIDDIKIHFGITE